MLRRFADARLRSALARETEAKQNAIHLARAIAVRLKAARAANVALAADLAAERARTQETAGRCGDVAAGFSLLASRLRPTCRLTAGHAGWHRGDDDSEWTMTQETNR